MIEQPHLGPTRSITRRQLGWPSIARAWDECQTEALTLGRRIRSLIFLATVLPVVFHRSVDVATILIAGLILPGALLYGLAPMPIDPTTGGSLPDKAVIPEILKARRTRRQLDR